MGNSVKVANPIEALFKLKKNKLHVTDSELGEKLGISREAICRGMNRPLGAWNIKSLVKYSRALDINPADLADAIMESVCEYK